jgi:hypothetical protein
MSSDFWSRKWLLDQYNRTAEKEAQRVKPEPPKEPIVVTSIKDVKRLKRRKVKIPPPSR